MPDLLSPKLSYRLPYTEASIREAMRYMTLTPSGVPHLCTEDTKFMGYDIPKVRNKIPT